MKKFIQTFKNIWTIDDLRSKISVTILLILIYRFGSHVALPGIDPNKLDLQSAKKGLLGLFDTFAGGSFSSASIFALGIMPYISASIFMQLMTILVPQMQKVQKEGDSGRKKINQWTRYLTALVTLFQAAAYVAYLKNVSRDALIEAYEPYFWISTIIVLTAGTLFVMWLGEKIQDKGLGNGTSIIIMVGILARLPQSFVGELGAKQTSGGGGLLLFLIEIAFLFAIILGLILLVQGVRKVPISYAKQLVGSRSLSGARQFLPLKVNASGVMPIIFAQAIMFLPPTIAQSVENPGSFLRAMSDYGSFAYNAVFAILIIAFTYFYTAITINPNQIAEDLKRNGGFIPGVKPGKKTANFIGAVMSRITLPGSIFLGFVAIFPVFAIMIGVNDQFAQFYGGTSLLIMVGVVLDTLQQVEQYLIMRHYDGLMKTGKIKGRSSVGGAITG